MEGRIDYKKAYEAKKRPEGINDEAYLKFLSEYGKILL